MLPSLHFTAVAQQLFTSYLCIFIFQKQLTKDFLFKNYFWSTKS